MLPLPPREAVATFGVHSSLGELQGRMWGQINPGRTRGRRGRQGQGGACWEGLKQGRIAGGDQDPYGRRVHPLCGDGKPLEGLQPGAAAGGVRLEDAPSSVAIGVQQPLSSGPLICAHRDAHTLVHTLRCGQSTKPRSPRIHSRAWKELQGAPGSKERSTGLGSEPGSPPASLLQAQTLGVGGGKVTRSPRKPGQMSPTHTQG